MIRKYQPEIVIGSALYDRHPDHGRGSELIYDSCFFSGLVKIETKLDGARQLAWRPKAVYHIIQSQFIMPDFIIDVSNFWETKMSAVKAYRSQFYDPDSREPETFISNPQFLKMIEARGLELGHTIGVKYGEGFCVKRIIGAHTLFDLI